jgi:hypothetical protein
MELNQHVTCELVDRDGLVDALHIFLTAAGIEAMFEGFYEEETQKDKQERFELRTRWVLPIASFLFSPAALVLSLLNHFYRKR